MMKKGIVLSLVLMLCATAALAAEDQYVWAADFDGDGEQEMFVVTGEDKMLYTAGKLEYVDGEQRTDVMTDAGFEITSCAVWEMDDGVLFKAEESYGIGSTVSKVFSVQDGSPEELPGMFSQLTRINGDEFYYMQMDTDLNTDHSGQTHKPYYVHWQEGCFMEHGGIYITEDELAAWEAGYDALDWIYRAGSRVKTVLYRENGVVNISYSDNIVNGNLSLQFIDGELCMLNTRMKPTDMPEDCNYGGSYLTMTGNTKYVTFAESFPQPQ